MKKSIYLQQNLTQKLLLLTLNIINTKYTIFMHPHCAYSISRINLNLFPSPSYNQGRSILACQHWFLSLKNLFFLFLLVALVLILFSLFHFSFILLWLSFRGLNAIFIYFFASWTNNDFKFFVQLICKIKSFGSF